MALNAKLNIYVVSLHPKDENAHLTFRDLLKSKYQLIDIPDSDLKNKFFKDFLEHIGKESFRKDEKLKKVIGVSEYDCKNQKCSLNILKERDVIEGIIDGGQYGILREFADVEEKSNKIPLDKNKAVLDKYYILLCTPLYSDHGFLFVQSYTESSVQEPIKRFIIELFQYEEEYYNVIVEPFVPRKFIEDFQRSAKIRMFTFRSKIGVSEFLRDDKILLNGQSLNVEIKITPIEGEFSPGSDESYELNRALESKKFDNVSLSDYAERNVYIQDDKKHKTHYDITKDLQSIKPTIYLDEAGIEMDEHTGRPNFTDLRDYTLDLLKEVQKEYDHVDEIEEI